ncbi:MAG: sigma-54 interaction domain-containing protein [Pseudomonadales bacterium]
MTLLASDRDVPIELYAMLEGYDCPAILVSSSYKILATNQLYADQFGALTDQPGGHCFEVSHGYSVPCDQAGESCPLAAAQQSKHRERVLHIHQTPRGREHVDVELLPVTDREGELAFFVELLRAVPMASTQISHDKMVGSSKAFTEVVSHITRVSQSDAAVMLCGESGTGKELAAKAIHDASARSHKPIVTLECAGLSEALFESELFGHIKGSFTGAISNKTGLVELANGGTLFLDEIGDVPLSLQVKLLRLLESQTYRPVGSAETRSSDFRLISATHRNLAEMVSRGEFRQDLYYRINVFPVRMPNLRERKDDIPTLAATILYRLSPNKEFHFTEPAMAALKSHAFRGNIRELRNVLNRALLWSDTNLIEERVILSCLAEDSARPADNSADNKWTTLKNIEADYLANLMEHCENDKVSAAKIAGISTRSLYRKLSRI